MAANEAIHSCLRVLIIVFDCFVSFVVGSYATGFRVRVSENIFDEPIYDQTVDASEGTDYRSCFVGSESGSRFCQS